MLSSDDQVYSGLYYIMPCTVTGFNVQYVFTFVDEGRSSEHLDLSSSMFFTTASLLSRNNASIILIPGLLKRLTGVLLQRHCAQICG